MRPTVSALAPSTETMNIGSRLWIISEAMSINRLTPPSTQMPGGMRCRTWAFGLVVTA